MKQSNKLNKGPNWQQSLLAAAVLVSFTFSVFGPIDLYFSNSASLWFTLRHIWWITALFGCAMFVIVYGIGRLLKPNARKLYTGFLFGGGLALYLQGNFLNLQYGIFDGSKVDWGAYSAYAWVNTLVWLAIIAIAIAFCCIQPRVMRKVIIYASCFILSVQAIALGVLGMSASGKSDEVAAKSFYLSENGLFETAHKNNVIVIVLDMFDERFLLDIADNDPQLLACLDGFTHYTNATGTYPTTQYAMPTLLTGNYASDMQKSILENTVDVYAGTDLYEVLDEKGVPVYLYTYENVVSPRITHCIENARPYDLRPSSNFALFKRLYKAVCAKYMPHVLKKYTWLQPDAFSSLAVASDTQGTENRKYGYFMGQDPEYYQRLITQKLSLSDEPSAIRIIHLQGAHVGPVMDADCNRVEAGSVSVTEAARGSLRIVGEYLAQLEELGVYDDAVIMIMGDHGAFSGTPTNPMLLLKQKNARGAMTQSSAPVCTADVAATIMEAVNLNENTRYGKAIWDISAEENRERRYYFYIAGLSTRSFYQEYKNRQYYDSIEFVFPNNTNDPSLAVPTGRLLSAKGIEALASCAALDLNNGRLALPAHMSEAIAHFDYGIALREDELWAYGSQALFSASLANYAGGDVMFTLEVGSLITESQRLRILCNDKIVGEYSLTQYGNKLSCVIPRNLIKDGRLELRLAYPDATTALWLGDWQRPDQSAYAFTFKTIMLSELHSNE